MQENSTKKNNLTFWEHVGELRSRLVISVVALVICSVAAHFFYKEIVDYLLNPVSDKNLVFLSPLDPLLFVMKIDLIAGFILALPIISYCVLSYIKPAFEKISWVTIVIFYIISIILIMSGVAYAFLVVLPITLHFLLSINIPGTENIITAKSYLNFILFQSAISAIIFQIPLFVIIGSYLKIFSIDSITSKRRYIYLGGTTLTAIITPTTDLFSLGLVMIPAIILFETSILASRLISKFV